LTIGVYCAAGGAVSWLHAKSAQQSEKAWRIGLPGIWPAVQLDERGTCADLSRNVIQVSHHLP
jgi:hypothetical protein